VLRLLAISGSLRKKSFNTQLLTALSEVDSEQIALKMYMLDEIPLYDADLEEQSGIPRTVEQLRKAIQSSDGMIIAMPEYNAGMPGVLKNALDWLTRPPKEMAPTFANRPLALCGATPGGMGTALAQAGSLVVFRQLKVDLFPEHLRVSGANQRLDPETGPDEKLAEQLRKWLVQYVEFIQRNRG